MRLTDLSPKWVTLENWVASDRPFYIGLTFYCPHCSPDLPAHGPTARRQRMAVKFWPPIDPTNVQATFVVPLIKMGTEWARVSGESFDTLTLHPSVDVSTYAHWHGSIKNGEIV